LNSEEVGLNLEEESLDLEEIELVEEPMLEAVPGSPKIEEEPEKIEDLVFDVVKEVSSAALGAKTKKVEPAAPDLSALEEIPLAEEVGEEEPVSLEEIAPVAESPAEALEEIAQPIPLEEESGEVLLEEVPDEIPYLETVAEEMDEGIQPASAIEKEADLEPVSPEELDLEEVSPTYEKVEDTDFEVREMGTEELSRAAASTMEKVAWEVIPDLAEKLVREMVKERIEKVAWEVVPDLAERLIGEEIRRLEEGIEQDIEREK
jgi:hypothetical protein